MISILNNLLGYLTGLHISRRLPSSQYGYFGDYTIEEYDSLHNETRGGYNFPPTLQRLKEENLRIVREGAPDAMLEVFPLLSSLLLSHAQSVVDFGGAFGKSYQLVKKFLPHITWKVVEQECFVAASEEFVDDHLSFHREVVEGDFLLVSSSLQYLKDPIAFLQKAAQNKYQYIFIDRTPFIQGRRRLAQQRITPKLYDATYPVWFFDAREIQAALPGYTVVHHYTLNRAILAGADAFIGGILLSRLP